MTLIFELDLDIVKLNQRARYLGQRSFRSKVIVRTPTDTHLTDCSIWTTKVAVDIINRRIQAFFNADCMLSIVAILSI